MTASQHSPRRREDLRPTCKQCAVVLRDGYRITKFAGHTFCRVECRTEWALHEVTRQRSWLSLIVTDTRGKAKDLASIALYSDKFATRNGG